MRCTECGKVSDEDAKGWRAYIADDAEDSETAEVVAYCPACAEIEFGDFAPPGT